MMTLELITVLAPTLVTITLTMGGTSSSTETPASSSAPATQTVVPVSSNANSAAPAATTSCGISGDFTFDVGSLHYCTLVQADHRSSTPYLSSFHPTTTPRLSLPSSTLIGTCSSPLVGHMFHHLRLLLCLRTGATWQFTYQPPLRLTAPSHNHPMQAMCRLDPSVPVRVLTITHTGSMQRHCMSSAIMGHSTRLYLVILWLPVISGTTLHSPKPFSQLSIFRSHPAQASLIAKPTKSSSTTSSVV